MLNAMVRTPWPLFAVLLSMTFQNVGFAQTQPASVTGGNEPAEDVTPPSSTASLNLSGVAVLLLATDPATALIAEDLNEFLLSEIANRGETRLIDREQTETQMGLEPAGSIFCVESPACIGRVGVQLGVAEIISGTIAGNSEQWTFNLNRIDVRTAEVQGRVFQELTGGVDTVVQAIADAVPLLYRAPIEPARLTIRANIENADVYVDGEQVGTLDNYSYESEDFLPGTHQLIVRTPSYFAWRRRMNIERGSTHLLDIQLEPAVQTHLNPAVYIAGIVSGVATAIAIPLFASSTQTIPIGQVPLPEELAFTRLRELERGSAISLFGLAGAALITSIVTIFYPIEEAVESTAISLFPLRDGISFQVRGHF